MVPGDLTTRTGGYIYDRRIAGALRSLGWSIEIRELDASFPRPTPAALAHAMRVLGDIPPGTRVIVDSLALGAMPDVIVAQAARLRLAALMHLPLAADVSAGPENAAHVETDEGRALAAVRAVVVTGTATRTLLSRYQLPAHRIIVVEPGTDRVPLARGPGGGPVQVLSVAAVHRGKGHERLLTALSTVPHPQWRLVCAGSVTRDPDTVERVMTMMTRLGLQDQVSFLGDLSASDLNGHYDRAELFVSPSRQETYGMAVADALARGLPVVATATGAIPDLVGSEAGLVVPVDDTAALSDALSRVIGDADVRTRLAAGARRVRDRLPTWDDAAVRMDAALTSLGTS